ncbi:MAG: HEAT repeat domain-containing protein [Nitrospirae bacterium]|nr:HEAT repeat domain-containing protein [Nitrospirota bacterium]
MQISELKNMIADYMEKGFLENIIDMFKHDKTLYPLIGGLITDERVRVRLGVSALIEALKKEDPQNIHSAVPNLLPLLSNPSPVTRGDAAYLLGIIGQENTILLLEEVSDNDKSPDVRLIAKEAVEEIKTRV